VTYSYDEIYLGGAMKNLGEALDYAVNACGFSIDSFMAMFVTCGLADDFGCGVPSVTTGISGTELVSKVMEKSGLKKTLPDAIDRKEIGYEYWCGKIYALYQWKKSLSFKTILDFIPPSTLLSLYSEMNEKEDSEVIEALDNIIKEADSDVRIQVQRKLSGHTQKSLAEASGVNLRTLQQYELKSKNINKASASALLKMAQVMGCEIESIMEPVENDN